MIGNGSLYEDNFNELISKNYTNVKFIRDFLTSKQIRQYHNDNNVFLAPTRLDTHGVSRAEAASSGLICLSSDVGAIGEFMSRESGVMAEKNSIKEYIKFFTYRSYNS